jgi:hypothetical protein
VNETARLVDLTIRRVSDGSAAYTLENAFGQSIQVLPRPPGFRATVVLEWVGAMPDEVAELVERARAAGIEV